MAKKILGAIGKVAKFAVLGPIGSALIGGGGKKSSTAAATDSGPKVMPLADDEAVKRARRVSMMRQMSRGGRTSTMLSDNSNSLGGGMY